MMKVFKYPLEIKDEVSVPMPLGAKILTVQSLNNKPCIWAAVDPSTTYMEMRKFRIAGTGHPIADSTVDGYIGTVQLHGGMLVFHVFEVNPI